MIHVLFSSSAAGSLRQLLSTRGLKQKVVDLTESLDWGPIASGSFRDREVWLNHHVPDDNGGWGWISEHVAEFTRRVSADSERLIWVAPRSAAEQSGLYWYLDHFGGFGAKMIVADFELRAESWGEVPPSLGILGLGPIAELFDECPRIPWDETRFPNERWKFLSKEDTLLRIVDNGVLKSAPENYFDQFLVERCPSEWTKSLYVIGNVMSGLFDLGHNVYDTFLFWRLCELIRKGEITCDGDLPRRGSVSGRAVKVRRAK